jgi:hypothetical protein
MNYFDLVKGLHGRFGRTMSEEAAEDYETSVSKFPLHIAHRAIAKLRKSCSSLPTPDRVEESCREAKAFEEREMEPAAASMKCCYGSPTESLLSRELCETVTVDDLKTCAAREWPVMCGWHQLCTQAKAFPDSSAMAVVRQTLADRREMKNWSGGELALFCKNLGFDPYRRGETEKAETVQKMFNS